MVWGRADVIIIEREYTVNVIHLNHPQTTTCPQPWSVGKLSSAEPVPNARKVGDGCSNGSSIFLTPTSCLLADAGAVERSCCVCLSSPGNRHCIPFSGRRWGQRSSREAPRKLRRLGTRFCWDEELRHTEKRRMPISSCISRSPSQEGEEQLPSLS